MPKPAQQAMDMRPPPPPPPPEGARSKVTGKRTDLERIAAWLETDGADVVLRDDGLYVL